MRLGDLWSSEMPAVQTHVAGDPALMQAGLSARAAALVIRALAYDSRRTTPGALFAAWRGTQADGHLFAEVAVSKGAAAVLCESVPDTLPKGTLCLVTREVRRTLALLARRFFGAPDEKLYLVGITGTNGKTTCARLVCHLFAAAARQAAALGTLGLVTEPALDADFARLLPVPLTTPESTDLAALLQALGQANVEVVAMEASSQALDQARLDGTRFNVALVTNVTQDHLDYHHTFAAYLAAKTKLIRERMKPGGQVALNFDDPNVFTLAGKDAWGFSAKGHPQARVSLVSAQPGPTHTVLAIQTPRGILHLRSPLVGAFNIENVLAVVTVGEIAKVPHATLASAIASAPQVAGRLERVSRAAQPLVLVDYAHTPDALRRALAATRELTTGKLFCVFGCGGDRDKSKRPLMGAVAAQLADQVIVTDDNPRSESSSQIAQEIVAGMAPLATAPSHVRICLSRTDAIFSAIAAAVPGDAVLIAGKGHETYQWVGDKRLDFDDREEARRALGRYQAREPRKKHDGI